MNKLTTLLAVCVMGSLASAVPASADVESWFYKRQQVECLAKTNPYTGGTLVAAKVVYTMGTTPHAKNNLRKMSLEVRLVPTGPGIRWNRTWRKSEISNVSADGANNRSLGHKTNFEVAEAGWVIEVRLTWRRRGKNDWEKKFEMPFNQSFCRAVG